MKSHLLAAFSAAALLISASAASAATINFTPLAGEGVVLDHTDGTGTSALFFNPQSVAIDSSGNVYVADSGDHTVRVINTAGTSSVLAGVSGTAGSVDGTGSGARFDYPYAIAVGTDGSVYVTDWLDGTVRKIARGGATSTIATGLNGPQGVTVDALNNVYVSDTNNNAIKKITGTSVTLFAGSITNASGTADGTGTAAAFNAPAGLATDSANNVYVADFGNSTVRMITPTGVVSTVAGTAGSPGYANAVGTAAKFNHPAGVAVDSFQNIYVVDTSNQVIRVINATTKNVSTLAGAFNVTTNVGTIGATNGASALTSTFFYPQGIAINSSATAIYIADTGNHMIRSLTANTIANGGTVTVGTFAGSVGTSGATNGAAGSSTFKAPYGVAVNSSGTVYIADQGNNLIRVLSGGNVSTLAGTVGVAGSVNGTGTAASFNNPSGVAADNQGNVYVADTGNNVVRKIVAATGLVTTFATGFSAPQGIAVDSAGNVYVADTGNNAIDKIVVTSGVAGGQSVIASGFNRPNAVAVDGSGNVYVSDFSNELIRKLTLSGTSYAVSTLAGTANVAGDVDGSPGKLDQPYGLAVDASGNVYVTDTQNRAVREISGGSISTVTGTQARFFYPEGIAIDSGGNLYVVDADNNEIDEGVSVSATSTGLNNHTVAVGGTATFSIISPNGSASYQWQYSTNGVNWTNLSNGGMYQGATTSALTVSGVTSGMNGYEYRALATIGSSSTPSPAGTLYVGTALLINLSSRGYVGPVNTGADLDAGFIISGSGTKNILLRGIGPTLSAFGVTDFLTTPTLTLYTSASAVQATNTVWGGSPTLANEMAAVGAFTLPANSADSVLYQTGLGVGTHTADVSTASTAVGEALVEVYDADTGTPSAHLSNISTRAVVGPINLIAGFIISGTTDETVLIRGVGPGLAPLGVQNTLGAAMLTLYDSKSNVVATNSNWSSNQAQLSTTFTQVGAFSLPAGSADAAMLVTLAPGSYTATVSSANGSTGTALVEIYEVP